MLSPPGKIRVFLVCDRPIERLGIKACLADAPQLEIVAEASEGEAALAQALRLAPDVVVMDEALPRLNGLAATAHLRRELPTARVLMLTARDHPDHLAEIIRAGACGCVCKDVAPEELRRAIERVAAGEPYFGMPETVRFLRRYRSAPASMVAEPINALTSREGEVLALVGAGLSNRQVADQLKIAVRTVETHRERIMRKLDIHDGGSLRTYAAAQKLLNSDSVSVWGSMGN